MTDSPFDDPRMPELRDEILALVGGSTLDDSVKRAWAETVAESYPAARSFESFYVYCLEVQEHVENGEPPPGMKAAVDEAPEETDQGDVTDLGAGYTTDGNHVWAGEFQVEDADAATFEVIGAYYARDANNVYCGDDIVDEADRDSFQEIGELTGRDATAVYLRNECIFGADPNTFQILDDVDVGWDENNIFFYGTVLEEADAASFQILGGGYYKDANRVYHQGRIIEDADPATFQVPEDPDASEPDVEPVDEPQPEPEPNPGPEPEPEEEEEPEPEEEEEEEPEPEEEAYSPPPPVLPVPEPTPEKGKQSSGLLPRLLGLLIGLALLAGAGLTAFNHFKKVKAFTVSGTVAEARLDCKPLPVVNRCLKKTYRVRLRDHAAWFQFDLALKSLFSDPRWETETGPLRTGSSVSLDVPERHRDRLESKDADSTIEILNARRGDEVVFGRAERTVEVAAISALLVLLALLFLSRGLRRSKKRGNGDNGGDLTAGGSERFQARLAAIRDGRPL
jgi:hypothetical protein